MCYTNPFTGPETWAGFEVSHSYPFCLILLCQRSQAAPRRMWSARGELSFHRLRDWARRWLSWPFCVPGQSGSGPGLSGRFRCFVWPDSVSTSPAASRDGIPAVWPWPPFRLLLLALRRLLEIVSKCMWGSISQKGGLLWINTHVSIICILLVMNACSNLSKMYIRLIFHQISCYLYIIIF